MKLVSDRYDRLQAQAKKVRNQIDSRNTTDDARIKKLQTEILNIKYKREVYIANKNNKLTDLNSLIANEQNRILKDKLQEEYDQATTPTPTGNKNKK
jgi:hypothetical protein